MLEENPNVLVYLVVTITFILAVFSGIMIYVVTKYIKKQFLNKLKIENLINTHENNLLKSQLQVQEQTFQNISREIHDNVGQKLTLAKLRLNTIETKNEAYIKTEITEIVQILSQAIDDLRDISRSMNSDLIATIGLVKTLENEISQLNRIFDYNFRMSVTGDMVYLDAEKELILFRIVQESLNNIIKHAEATQIFLDIHYTKFQVEIRIVDNGIGFDKSKISDSNGLSNIRMRAKMLNGVAEIEPVTGKGTTVTIKIPLSHES